MSINPDFSLQPQGGEAIHIGTARYERQGDELVKIEELERGTTICFQLARTWIQKLQWRTTEMQ